MNFRIVMLFLLTITIMHSISDIEDVTRKKRYVVFPEGSSFSIALCLTMHTLTPDNIFTEGVNWGISYDLPNESKPELDPFLQLRKDRLSMSDKNYKLRTEDQKFYTNQFHDPMHRHDYLQRRYRRNLYNKLEVVINAMGFDGRKCIFRALCEAAQRLMPRGKTLIEEMIRTVFALPVDKLFPFEPDDHHDYARAYGQGRKKTTRDCAAIFPECSFSLIDMALGKYDFTENFSSTDSLNKIMSMTNLAGGRLNTLLMK